MLTFIRRKNQAGFTLIEMMVAVAIVGILAAIVIPAYKSFIGNARQSEAKSNLGGIFVNQTTFKASEGRFGGMPQILFSVAGSTNRYTYRSQSTDNTGAPAPQPGDVINASVGVPTADNTTYPAASSAQGFTATATADIDGDPTNDEWYVNDLKVDLQTPTTDDRVF